MTSSTGNERTAALKVAQETMAAHRHGIELLRALSNQANGELADTNGRDLPDAAVQFRLAVLSNTINHAWKIGELIETGYPRVALSLARVLRESHIAILWSMEAVNKVRAEFEALRLSGSLERGSWPTAGEMAQQVSAALQAAGHSQAAAWDKVVRQYGDTHNQLFAHAISDFALTTSLLDNGKFSPVVGPVYVPGLVEITTDHFVPLFLFTLNDAAKVAAHILGRDIPQETTNLLAKAGEWWEAHPPVQIAG